MDILVEIYFPLVSDYPFEEYPFEHKEKVISEINNALKIKNDNILQEYIIDYTANLDLLNFNEKLNPFQLSTFSFEKRGLRFEFIVEVDPSSANIIVHNGTQTEKISDLEEIENFILDTIGDQFGDLTFELLLLSQISRPGSLKMRGGNIFIDGQFHSRSVPKIINLRESIVLNKKDYPTIQYLEFDSFYQWVLSKNSLFPLHPNNSFQKALNNFSYLNDHESPAARLVYQMRILEDIYTQGVNQIAKQLNAKIQLFLGKMEKFKKQIKEMYDIRSRFLHG